MTRGDFVMEPMSIYEQALRRPESSEAHDEIAIALSVLELTHTAEELEAA